MVQSSGTHNCAPTWSRKEEVWTEVSTIQEIVRSGGTNYYIDNPIGDPVQASRGGGGSFSDVAYLICEVRGG